MRISDWSSDVCSSDLPSRTLLVSGAIGSTQSGCPDDQIGRQQDRGRRRALHALHQAFDENRAGDARVLADGGQRGRVMSCRLNSNDRRLCWLRWRILFLLPVSRLSTPTTSWPGKSEEGRGGKKC